MLIPIGTDKLLGEKPWMTWLLIAICVVVHLQATFSGRLDRQIKSFCDSSLAAETIEALEDLGFQPDQRAADECEAVIEVIISGKAIKLVDQDQEISPSEKANLRRLLARAEKRLNIWGLRAFDPRHFSLVTIVTSAFSHSDWYHLIGNMLFLWVFGAALEGAVGPFGLLGIFLGSAVFANIIYFLCASLGFTQALPTLGASAGIYGVLAGVWRKYPRLNVNVILWMVYLVRMISIRAYLLIGFYVLQDALILLLSNQSEVNLIAHLAGFVVVYILLDQEPSNQLVP